MKTSGDDRSLLVTRFAAAKAHGEGSHSRGGTGKEGAGAEEEAGGSSSPSAAIDYDAFVRWLSEGGGLDDALLGKVQRHLKARLSK